MDYDKLVEFLKTLKFSKNELLADNYKEIIDQRLTTKPLCEFVISNIKYVWYELYFDFIKCMLLTNERHHYKRDIPFNTTDIINRFNTLKSTLNVANIKDSDKLYKYAYVYYTNDGYEHCCKNTNDLYDHLKELDKFKLLQLENSVLDALLREKRLVEGNTKLECFTFYQNFINKNMPDIPLSQVEKQYAIFGIYNNFNDILEEKRNRAIEKIRKDQAKSINMKTISDSIEHGLSVSKLKKIYPYCAVIRYSYSSGWAQSASKEVEDYYFTNLSKSEIKAELKDRGINTKEINKQYENGTSYHYEYGGTAIAHEKNHFSYIPSSEVSITDASLGTKHHSDSWTAGFNISISIHVIAKSNNSDEIYKFKNRPGKLYYNKTDEITVANIFGETNEVDGDSIYFWEYKDNECINTGSYDDFIKIIVDKLKDDSYTYEMHCSLHIKSDYNEIIPVISEKLSSYVVNLISDKYKVNINQCINRKIFEFKLENINSKDGMLKFLEDANNGIPITIPEDNVRYVLVNIDSAYAYLIMQEEIIDEKPKIYKIDRKLFDEVFEKV